MIIILTGPVNSGKTTLLKRVVEELRKQNFSLDGFLSEAVVHAQEKIGYNLLDLKLNKSLPFIRKSGHKDWQKIGPYFFIPQGLAWANQVIRRSKEAEILIVDEIGPLELSGKGLWPVLEKALSQKAQKFLFILRRNIVEDFLDMAAITETKVFDIEEKQVLSLMLQEITIRSD